MINRLQYAIKGFFFAWKTYKMPGVTMSEYTYQNTDFRVTTFDKLRSNRTLVPEAVEDTTMLRKRCVDKDGNVRYFDVVPEEYEQVILSTYD